MLRWAMVGAMLLLVAVESLVASVSASRLACGVCEAIVDEVRNENTGKAEEREAQRQSDARRSLTDQLPIGSACCCCRLLSVVCR